jgi:hypothetical protein
MEKKTDSIDEKLFTYLDGHMSAEEKNFFEQAMSHSPNLKAQVEIQQQADAYMTALQIEEPSAVFAQQVMAKINQAPQSYSLSTKNGLLLLLGVLFVSLVAILLLQSGVFDATGTLNAPKELGLLSKYIKAPLPSIPINGKLIVNGIILLNLALGFVILDRAILRPYFERRMRHS